MDNILKKRSVSDGTFIRIIKLFENFQLVPACCRTLCFGSVFLYRWQGFISFGAGNLAPPPLWDIRPALHAVIHPGRLDLLIVLIKWRYEYMTFKNIRCMTAYKYALYTLCPRPTSWVKTQYSLWPNISIRTRSRRKILIRKKTSKWRQ